MAGPGRPGARAACSPHLPRATGSRSRIFVSDTAAFTNRDSGPRRRRSVSDVDGDAASPMFLAKTEGRARSTATGAMRFRDIADPAGSDTGVEIVAPFADVDGDGT